MKPSSLSRSLAFLLAVLAPVLQAQTLDQGQWNVNNHGTWFNSANWQNGVPPSSVGASAIINQDFGPGRMIADFTQVATMTAAAGTAQQLVTLSKIPVNGSISVTDGTFFWSQGRGASSTAWTVVYNSGPNQIGVTYNPALTGNRTLTIAYATAEAVNINEVVGAAERIGATDGVATTFTRVLTLFPDEGKIGVTDGTYHWTRTKSALGVVSTSSSDDTAFNASYDPSSRQITVTYTNLSYAVTGRNIVIVYFPAGTQGTKDLAVNTLASDTPVTFSRELRADPVQNSSFIIASGGTTWVNGTSSSPTSFEVAFAGPRSVTVTFRAGGTSSSTPIANLAGGPNGLRLITADYATASGAAKNVTLGNLHIGDINGGDRVNLNLNSLTFDTTGGSAQLNKIVGGPDEIAGNITLNNSLTMAVRTGGDVVNKNISLISANISGSGSLTKLDSGNVALSGNNSYTGDTFFRNTGGTVFLGSSAGNAISSDDLFLGNASRDGHTSMFMQLSGANQMADNTHIWFDAASGRNAHLKMAGFSDAIASVSDYTGQGVIENTQDEADFNTSSVLTLNSSANYSFNGVIRNKNSASSSGTIGITKTGTGTQTLAGNSIFYSGPTTVTGGTLRLFNMVGQGSLPFNPEPNSGGTIGGAFGGADVPRFRSNVANSGTVELAATTAWTFGNVISGTGAVTKTGTSNLRVTNSNTYQGATTVSNGTLTLASGVTGFVANSFNDFVSAADNNGTLAGSQRLQAIYGHGALVNTSAVNLFGGGLTLNNGQDRPMLLPGTSTSSTVVFNQTNRVNDAAPINSNAGTITFSQSFYSDTLPKVNFSETLGTLNLLGGRSQVTTSQAPSGATSKLTFAGLTRNAGSTINFSGADIGANSRNEVGFTAAPALPNGIIGGWATVSTINPANNALEHDFATYSGSSVVKYSGYTTTASGTSANQANWTLANNYNLRINGLSGTSNQHTINVTSGSSAATNVPKVLNTLKFDDSTAKTINLRTTLARTLILESGGLISRGANHIIGASATAGQGFLSAGPGSNYELLPWVENGRTLVINAQVADHWNGTTTAGDEIPVRVVKSGPGVLQLYGNNLHTGGTTINQGVVEIDLISGLGPTPPVFKQDYLTFNGGTIEAKTPSTGSTENMIFEDKMGITLGTQGGFFALKNGITTTINSKITGPGGLQMGGGGAGADSAGGVLELAGLNDFTGPLSVITGQVKILGGSNTFGEVSIRGATLNVVDGAAWPTTKPTLTISGGEFDVGGNIAIGQLSGAGGISSGSATGAVNLIVDQDSNSTFTGTIAESTYALSFEKRGKGTLILNTSDSQAQASSFIGVVNIVEGVLQANVLDIRDRSSSIGQGNYDASVITGDTKLLYSEKSASNLIIGNGAALAFAGDFPQSTNRPFTIGVGDLGASLLANSAALGNTIHFYQGNLVVSDTDFTPIGYDTIEFSSANVGATLNLGGRNQGTNRFAMDLSDNGTAPLSVTKTGDGTWIMGEHNRFTNEPIVTPSRNTYTGRTTIYLGTLGVQQSGVFGAAGGESVNLIGGNLDLRNVDYTVNEALSMAGGRLRAPFGTNAWTGGISLDVNSVTEIGTDASLRIRGPVIGKGALIKVGFGTLILENQNSYTGTMEVQEGTLRLDYTNNKGSKLPDGGALVLGGARQGATLDLVGGNGATIIEVINNMNVRLGLNRITRSDPAATGTIVRLNSLPDFRIAQGAALDFAASSIAQTDRLNNSAGLLGPWATVNKSDWATNLTNSVDGYVAAYTGYVANTWSGLSANVNVTANNTVADGSVANSLRFNQASSNVVTLAGDVLLKSGGVLQTPATGAVSNVITGGRLVLENNTLGGNLMVHQHGTASALTIRSEIVNSANPADMTGTIYRDSVNNRFRAPGANDGASAAAVIAAAIYVGMPVTEVFTSPQIMSRLEPGTVVSGVDYNNGNVSFSQGATADINVPISITTTTLGVISLQGETMLSGVQNRVRVRATAPGDSDKLKAIASGNPISGGTVGPIPGGAIVTGVTLDNKDTPTSAILSINLNIPIPAAASFTIRFQSRNGVAKFGDGRLVLSGANTFTGPVFINGGVLSVTEINTGGSPGPLGAGSSQAANIQISGATLEYVGNSVTTDRGFTINELGSVEVARSGAVADFTGNLSGGVGAALGILEKSGEGTLKLTRILGNAESPLPGAQLTQFTPATAGTGGGTNFGGFLVKNGTLKLAYENPNSNENSNRFAASTAALTMAGGRLELVGMDNVNWPGDDDRTNFPVPIGSPSENRTQQLLGQLTLSSGGSEIVVTGGSGTTTTLNLQNPADPKEVIREPGATVHFVENPQGTNSNVGITLSIPAFFQNTPLPWATYKDTSRLNSKGVNDFAAIESIDDGILSADDKFLYVIASDVSQWPSNQPVSEGAQPFFGSTADIDTSVYLLRFFNKQAGTIDVTGILTLSGGAILVGTNVGDTVKRIQGGALTSELYTQGTSTDLIIHNYNPSRAFEISSQIIDSDKPVNLVHTGDGTTQLLSDNGYTGSTYLNGGVLRLSSANALPGGVGVSGGISNLVLHGGVLGLESDFNRPLGTGPEAVQFAGAGGFSAYGATRTVNFGGAGAAVQWGQGGFAARGGSLLLSSYDADATVRLVNPINLGATYRQVDVADGSAAVDAELSGVLSGVGASIGKLGQGTLRLTAANTFTGGTTLAQGTLLLAGSGLGDISVGTVDATAVSDAVTLQFGAGSSVARLSVGNKNAQGITTLKVSGNSTVTNGVDLQRDIFVDAAPGRTLTISGDSGGFNPGTGANSTVNSVIVLPNGMFLLGGDFTTFDGVGRNYVARLNSDGSLDATFDPGAGASGPVYAMAIQSDGKVLIGGNFTTFDGVGRNYVARLHSDGSLDTTFNPGTGADNTVTSIAVQSDGRVLIGGGFTTFNGVGRNRVARLNTDGSLDSSFNPGTGADNTVFSVAVQTDGKVLIGGDFANVGGSGRNRVARLRNDGSLDTTFDSSIGANGTVASMLVQSDGKVLLGGDFSTVESVSRGRVARLNGDGSLDATFDPGTGANGMVYSLAVQTDGKVLLGGSFTNFNGTRRDYAARLSNHGALDTSFNSGNGANSIIYSVSVRGDSRVLVGGGFTAVNGTARNRVALLSGGAAGIRVNDGGSVSFNGNTAFGIAGGSQGAAIDGGVVVRNGIVMIGSDASLGTANIELGDLSSSLAVASVERSSAGRSVLERAGEYDGNSGGLPGDVDGTGAFIYENQSTLTIDGHVFGRADSAVLGVLGDTGLYILVNGESDHPERNGIYELFYSDGVVNDNDSNTTADTADDIISLRRVTAFDDQTEHDYGARIKVLNGTDANKTFFLATNQPAVLPTPDTFGRVLISTPVYWKEEASLNPNVSLLAAAAGLTIPNTVDVNNTNGTGATTLGGGVNFTSGTSTFTGDVKFQGQVPTAESKTVRFTSESSGGRGAEFTGVISQADPLDSLAVVKVGSGVVTFSGENTYKGGTLVNSGTLLVNNFDGSGTGSGAVTVSNFGSTLGGMGTIAGATSLLSGAALMPGDPTVAGGVESLLFENSLTLGADSSLWMQWTSELLADELIVNGLFTADATAVIKVLLEFVPLSAMTIDLIDWGSISAPGGLADRLDLPALASSTLFWDTSAFSSSGELSIAVRNVNGPPPVHFSIREAAVREGAAAVRIAVELDWEPTAEVTVPIITSGSAAIGALADYTLSLTPVTFNIGERSKELVITVRDDPAAEFTEKIVLTIGTPTNAIKGSPTTFTLTVVDNDSGLPLADRWDLRNPQPTNETLTGLALVDTTLVAVGTKGSIFSSTNGIAWTKRPLPVGFALNAIASDGVTFVAVGENGNVVTSTNGIDWVIRSVGGGKTLLDVVWTGTAFVAVGVDGVTYNSDDGLAWSFNTSNLIEDIQGVTTSPSQLIAVGEGGVVVSSSDNGTTWTSQASNTTTGLNSVAYNGSSLYVAVGDGGGLVTSADGVNWTAGSTGSGANLNSVRWDGSLFTAVGSGGVILTSANGTSWTARTSGITDGLEVVSKLGSQWLAVGEAGMILTSPNATAWTRQSTGPTDLLVGVAEAGTQFVAVGAEGTLMTSPDGAAWTLRSSPVNATFNSVAGSASLIIAVGNGGAAVKSTNGSSWTNAVSGVAQNLHDIVLSGGVYYAVGDAGTLLKTTDGVTWDALVSNTIEDLRGIASNGSLLLAVGSNGAAIMSSDAGATWVTVDIGGTASLLDITWTGSTFIAVGGGSNIFTTTDGLVWTKRSAPQLASLTNVAGNATGALACGLDGIAFLSTDGGATWQKRDTGTSRSLQGIGVNTAGRFVAVGQVGTILTTEQIAPPPPSVFFTLLSQSVSEETAGVVNLEVNISPAPTAKVTVPFTLTAPAGTATLGATKDYTFSPASPLVFTSGQTTKTISITVKNDNLVEANETVIVTLLTPTDDSLPTADPVLAYPSQHTLTIVNVDEAPLIPDSPDHAIVALGASHTFNATATGSAPLTQQWQKGTANVAGALGASYTIPSTLITSGGSYRLKASNPVTPAGVFSAPADLVVVDTGYKLTMAKPNATATLTVNYGGPATAFRWFKDNVEITADTAEIVGFNKKTLTIKTLSAVANEEGFYKCRVTGQGGDLFTGNYEVREAETPQSTSTPSAFPGGKVGTPYTPYDVLTQHFNLDINNRPTKWTISGQPTGLSISSTGVISGTPQVSITTDTTYNVKVSASNATGVIVSFTAPMTIVKLDANAIGAFVGLVERSGTLAGGTGTLDLGGRLDVTTTSNAKFTGSLTIGTSTATKHPITGLLDTSGANPTATVTIVRTGGRSTLTLSFTLNIGTNLVSGTVTDATPTTAALTGWRNVWKNTNPGANPASLYDGRHNVMAAIPATLEGDIAHPSIPQGDNYFSVVVDLAGKGTVSGKSADGTVIATTAQIGPNGEVLVYQAMYATTALGSFIGMLDIDTNTAQTVTGDVSWNKPAQVATAANLYRSGFGQVIDLEVAGGLYTPPPAGTGAIIMAADPGQPTNAGMTFFDVTGLSASPTATNNPNLPTFRLSSPATFVKPIPNPDAHALTFVTSTGSFNGSFKLTDTASAARTVPYWGLVIPDTNTPSLIDGIGAGYFILKPFTTTPTAAQKSGRVTIIPVLEVP